MSESKPLVNRVAQSSLITLKLEEYLPDVDFSHFDIKDYLFKELILKEKDFRTALKELDWTPYEGKVLLVYCSTDAIVPMWAYMLIASYASPHVADVFSGREADYYGEVLERAFRNMDFSSYQDARLVIKGCADKPVPPSAYLRLTHYLRPYARSIMFGEPCSTVPIYKKPRK
jgi:hypothetical protein